MCSNHVEAWNKLIIKFSASSWLILTLNLLTWWIWWAPNNASKWQMEFNLAFKGLFLDFSLTAIQLRDALGSRSWRIREHSVCRNATLTEIPFQFTSCDVSCESFIHSRYIMFHINISADGLPHSGSLSFAYSQWRTQEFCSGGGGSTNSVEGRGQRERTSGGGSPLVRGSGGSCNLVQEILFHIV